MPLQGIAKEENMDDLEDELEAEEMENQRRWGE